jgi:hypothetical protein
MDNDDIELEDIHNCEQCQGKIVCISVDELGVTRCGYCNEVVDYRPYYDNLYKQKILEFINTKKEESKWQVKKKNKKRKKVRREEIRSVP